MHFDEIYRTWRVSVRMSANMKYQYLQRFTIKQLIFRTKRTNFSTIYVAVNRS